MEKEGLDRYIRRVARRKMNEDRMVNLLLTSSFVDNDN